VRISCDGAQDEIVGSHLLLAVGRRPNTDDLGLDQAGIETDSRGFIIVDDQLRTNVALIWATGDVNGRGAFTHTSYNDYEIVAANLFDDDPRRVTDRIICYGLYIDPPLGRVGMTEREVRAAGRKALIGKMPMTRVGRARERSETQGFMKILIDAQDRPLDPRRNVRRRPVHRNSASRTHPPDSHRADPDHARRSEAPQVSAIRCVRSAANFPSVQQR
jgi:pyruvate/2-oxoglutarate dehydrogenase complex dihydrolipoamide dehydrogenase (E3) component